MASAAARIDRRCVTSLKWTRATSRLRRSPHCIARVRSTQRRSSRHSRNSKSTRTRRIRRSPDGGRGFRARRSLLPMATELKLPELGENVEKGDVVRVLVKPGDTIKKDQPVVELETDKATIEVPSDVDGTVAEVKVKPGDRVKVGQVILTTDSGKAEVTEKPGKPEAAEKAGKSEAAEKTEIAEKGAEPREAAPAKTAATAPAPAPAKEDAPR